MLSVWLEKTLNMVCRYRVPRYAIEPVYIQRSDASVSTSLLNFPLNICPEVFL